MFVYKRLPNYKHLPNDPDTGFSRIEIDGNVFVQCSDITRGVIPEVDSSDRSAVGALYRSMYPEDCVRISMGAGSRYFVSENKAGSFAKFCSKDASLTLARNNGRKIGALSRAKWERVMKEAEIEALKQELAEKNERIKTLERVLGAFKQNRIVVRVPARRAA